MFSLDIDQRIARITITPPGKLNAISLDHWRQLAMLASPERLGEARALILQSGEDAIFCAGADVAEFATLQGDPAARTEFRETMRAGLDALAACPIPTIALVDAGCVGAGIALILACDIRISGDHALFAVTPARLGLAYQVEDVMRLVEAVGRGHAARMLFSAEMLDAEEALRVGLVQLLGGAPMAANVAQAIAGNSGESVAALLAILRAADKGRSDAATAALFDEAFGSRDFAEGLAAFEAHRRPDFG